MNVVVLDKSTELNAERGAHSDPYFGYEPTLMQASRQIYQTFMDVHPSVTEEPLGVAIDRYSYRGKLIFNRIPALLPQEAFIPFDAINR